MVIILAVAGVVSALTAMRFAIRGREVEVPQLAGRTQEEAEQILRGRGLKLRVSSSRFSSEVAEGRVLEQIPPSGTTLKVDRTVRVLLSLGEQRYAVPNLIGTTWRNAVCCWETRFMRTLRRAIRRRSCTRRQRRVRKREATPP
ncbi:MAG: hypothetical protein DMG14_34095 [Acidobacteria bacterium]|nr:MAG: hypothetical protein DMG14_34095 [Acidobacteriota bacterium]